MPITSNRSPKDRSRTVYQVKKASSDPDDQAEVRMAELFFRAGNRVHFTDGVGKADLRINGILTDVKHIRGPGSIKSAITGGKKQGARVLIDGSSVRLSLNQATSGICEFEKVAQRHPGPLEGIKQVLIVLGNFDLMLHDRGDTVGNRSISWRNPIHRV